MDRPIAAAKRDAGEGKLRQGKHKNRGYQSQQKWILLGNCQENGVRLVGLKDRMICLGYLLFLPQPSYSTECLNID